MKGEDGGCQNDPSEKTTLENPSIISPELINKFSGRSQNLFSGRIVNRCFYTFTHK